MSYIYDLNIVTDTLSNMLSQFKGKDNISAIIEIFANQVQDIEDTLNQLATLRNLPNATGVQLDNVGDIIGLQRNGLSDSDYRTALYIQAAINSSDGTIERIISVLSLLTGSTVIKIEDEYPAKIRITIDASSILSSTVATVLAIKPCGVGLFGGVIYRYGFLMTEDDDFLITEDEDRILVEEPF